MASITSPKTVTTPTSRAVTKPASPETELERRIDQMRSHVRRLDLLIASLIFAVALLLGMLVFVILDSWVIAGGFSVAARCVALAIFLVSAVIYAVFQIVPLAISAVSPAYAAMQIEANQPSLKNTVLNWLLLRHEHQRNAALRNNPISSRVLNELGRSASERAVIGVPRALERDFQRWIAILIATFVAVLVYFIVSPKSPLPSVGRLMLPFTSVLPPQRIYLENITPGNATKFCGEKIKIEVTTSRDPAEIPVEVVYSTEDGKWLRQRAAMTQIASREDGKFLFATESFPPGNTGLETNLIYWIECGDSRSETYRLEVREGLSIDVFEIHLTPPDYTQLPKETLKTGNAEAIEGTVVHLIAQANRTLARGFFESEQIVPMQILRDDPKRAELAWKLETVGNCEYTIEAEDEEKNRTPRGSRYKIVTIADEPPVVKWENPPQEEIVIPANAKHDFSLVASDPDFALRTMRVFLQKDGLREKPRETSLLESPRDGAPPHKGEVRQNFAFAAESFQLKENDQCEIWCEVTDSKLPNPNKASTEKIRIRISAPEKEQEPQNPEPEKNPEPQPQNQESQENQSENQNQDEQNQSADENKEPQQNQSADGNNESQKNQSSDGNKEAQQNQSADGNKESQQNQSLDGNKEAQQNQSADGNKESQQNQSSDGNKEAQQNQSSDGNKEAQQNQSSDGNKEAQQNQSADENQQCENPQSGNSPGKKSADGNKEAQGNKSNSEKVDPEAQPGDAMEKILEHMQKKREQGDAGDKPENEPRERADDLDKNGKQKENQEKSEGKSESESSGKSEGQSGEKSEGKSGGENPSQEPQENQEGKQGKNGGGGQASNAAENSPDSPKPDSADDPRLDFTRNATNLALEYLEDQAQNPDDELLKSLGWSKEDLARFTEHWKKTAAAAQTSEEAKQNYDELLRSVGLEPNATTMRSRAARTEFLDRSRETQSRRTPPPAPLKERFKSYNERIGN